MATNYLQRKYKFSAGMEASYADGGSSFSDLPVFIEGMPDPNFERTENPVFYGSLQRNRFIAGQTYQKVKAKYFLKGAGSAGVIPEIGKLFRIAGLFESQSANDVSYYPVNDSFESATIQVNQDGLLYGLSGSRVDTMKITLQPGMPSEVETDITSLYSEPTVAAFSNPTFTDVAVVPPIVQTLGMTIGAKTYSINKVELELKNVLTKNESINAGNRGIQEFVVVGREWGGSAMIQRSTDNDTEFWNAVNNSTEFAVLSVGFGTAAGNRMLLDFSNFQLEDIKPAEVGGILYYDCKFRVNTNPSLPSEFTLKFY